MDKATFGTLTKITTNIPTTMKTIYFLRHAHAPEVLRQEDVERPIDVKGKMEASSVAFYAKQHLSMPEACFVSHAKRAQQTARYFKEAWEIKDDSYILSSVLYDFDGEKIKDFIFNLSEEWDCVLLVGHNPAISNLVNYFGDKSVAMLPTSGMVSIVFDCNNWHALKKGETTQIILPNGIK